MLSLAVLFEVDKSEMVELEKRIISENFDDYFVNILLHKIDSSWTINGTEFEFDTYDCLKPILDHKEDEHCELLKDY